MPELKNPMQPMYLDDEGQARFKENKIIGFLLDSGKIDLNMLWALQNKTKAFPQDDWDQFYQLIGYPLSGYGELSIISDEAYSAAAKAAKLLK